MQSHHNPKPTGVSGKSTGGVSRDPAPGHKVKRMGQGLKMAQDEQTVPLWVEGRKEVWAVPAQLSQDLNFLRSAAFRATQAETPGPGLLCLKDPKLILRLPYGGLLGGPSAIGGPGTGVWGSVFLTDHRRQPWLRD